MKTLTKEADKIYNYYIKIEKIIFEYIQEKYKEQNNIVSSTLISLKNKENELIFKDSKIKELQSKLSSNTSYKYEDIETTQSIYVFFTDIEGVYKIGESFRDITKRKKELQTLCVKNIIIIFEFKTFNSRLYIIF